MKRTAAEAALDYIEVGDIVGVGTGSTAVFPAAPHRDFRFLY